MSTQLGEIVHYWDCRAGSWIALKSVTKLGVPVRTKKWAVDILSTLNRYRHHIVKFM